MRLQGLRCWHHVFFLVASIREVLSKRVYGNKCRLTEGVATSNQCNRLRVVHTHASERCANIQSRGSWVGNSVRSDRVDVNQTHVGVGQRDLKTIGTGVNVGAAVVPLVVSLREPLGLRAPVDALICLPGVDTATTIAQSCEVEGLQGDVSRQDNQVGPRKFGAVLLLDRPYQATSLVETSIVGPAAEWCKTLLSL